VPSPSSLVHALLTGGQVFSLGVDEKCWMTQRFGWPQAEHGLIRSADGWHHDKSHKISMMA
jgi:hypothetical protein